ncbi:MAG: NosD domain-containing protein, partial [Promethearchaeota archaeon]
MSNNRKFSDIREVDEKKIETLNKINLKIANSEISIITPENRTYTNPMSGYYPASYGFENDKDGEFPTGWSLNKTVGTCQVISSLGTHEKLVEFYDSNNPGQISIRDKFTAKQGSGTVELYFRSNNIYKRNVISLHESSTLDGIYLRIDDGKMEYRTSMGYTDITSLSSNKWHHIRIEFNSILDKSWIFVDGSKYGGSEGFDFRNPNTGMRYLLISSGMDDLDYYFYIDAVGYSWDPNYNVGDNTKEGLLLSLESNTNLDWMGYSLDGQSNKSILGNTAIPMPDEGPHTIQVFGNDSLGNMYQSNVRHFTIALTIFIDDSDPNYNWSKTAAENDWCSGSGAWNDPYIIENLDINGYDSGSCIIIENSNMPFIIRNCTLYNAGGAWDAAGIKLANINNGRLDNNTCSNSRMGIKVNYQSNNNTITGNILYDNENAIDIDGDNNTITGNTVTSIEDGIDVYGDSNNVAENTVYNIEYDEGIHIYGDKNNITGNILYNNEIGISLSGSNSLLLNNIMDDCGIEIRGDLEEAISHDIDTTNEVNGKPVYYYANETGLKSNDFKKYGDPGQAILVNCTDSIVSDLNISHSSGGITLSYCENNTIYNNTVSYNSYAGIDLFESSKNNISENFVYNNSRGINMDYCNNNNVTDNILNGNRRGIALEDSYNIIVKNNTLNNFRVGIDLREGSYNNTLTQNSMTNCGVDLDLEDTQYPTSNKIDTTNTVNGKPLYYYTNEIGLKPINFANAGQVILINCNDSLISDFDVSYGTNGLLMYDCNNNTISNVTASYNYQCGIHLENILNDRYNFNNISGNTANNNGAGIVLEDGNYNIISGNTANNNEEVGIVLGDGNYNIISSNTANNTEEEGIVLNSGNYNNISGNAANKNGGEGIRLSNTNNSVVCNNIANENLEEGILLESCVNNTILGNDLKDNKYAGIYLTFCEDDDDEYEHSSNDNTLIGNNFVNNTVNAIDEGINNQWDNGSIGNFWDDYDGMDINDDGIGDTPYIISGTAGSQDNFPIWDDGPSEDLQPISDFFADQTTILEGNAVAFTFMGFEGNAPASYYWEFGDGGTSIEQNPTHQYDNEGNYTVNLTVTDYDGDSDVEIKTDYITVNNLPPNVDFIADQTTILEGDAVTFTFMGFEGNAPASYYWEFGDGDTSIEQNPTHQYDNEGNYTVNLTVTDYDGDSDVEIKTDYIVVLKFKIYINGVAAGVDAHNWSWAKDQWWCSGSGTWNDPYIIENLDINGFNSGSCITIENSNVPFIIRNCKVYNSGSENSDAGIKLNNVNYSRIINNDCLNNNKNGIILEDCFWVNISGNTANENYYGISLTNSAHISILKSIVNNNGGYGIYLQDCDDNNIIGNNANNNSEGIHLEHNCHNNTILGNTANNNLYYGISLEYNCHNNTISRNSANDNFVEGIQLFYYCDGNTISGNTASNIGTSNQKAGISLGVYCDANNISENAVNNNDQTGISLDTFCESNIILGNNASNIGTSNQKVGIYLYNSNDNDIIENNAKDNYFNGLRVIDCHFCNINDNIIIGNVYGLYLQDCNDNDIIGNTISNNGPGIHLENNCHNNT